MQEGLQQGLDPSRKQLRCRVFPGSCRLFARLLSFLGCADAVRAGTALSWPAATDSRLSTWSALCLTLFTLSCREQV